MVYNNRYGSKISEYLDSIERFLEGVMLTLENVSFEVQAEKGQKEIIHDLNLSIDDHSLSLLQDRMAVASLHWRS